MYIFKAFYKLWHKTHTPRSLCTTRAPQSCSFGATGPLVLSAFHLWRPSLCQKFTLPGQPPAHPGMAEASPQAQTSFLLFQIPCLTELTPTQAPTLRLAFRKPSKLLHTVQSSVRTARPTLKGSRDCTLAKLYFLMSPVVFTTVL